MKSAYQDVVEEVKNLKGVEEAVALAIEREKEARDFYLNKATLMDNPKLKELYEHLANEEVKHLGYLEGYRDQKELPVISTEIPSGQSFTPEFDIARTKGGRSLLEMQASLLQPSGTREKAKISIWKWQKESKTKPKKILRNAGKIRKRPLRDN